MRSPTSKALNWRSGVAGIALFAAVATPGCHKGTDISGVRNNSGAAAKPDAAAKPSDPGQDRKVDATAFLTPPGVNNYGLYPADRGYTFGTFTPDPLYATINAVSIPAAHKRVDGAGVTMSWGNIFSDSVQHMVTTQVVTNDLRVPTKCVLAELQFRQKANNWTDQQLEDEVARNAVLLPIDESQVHAGAPRALYALGAIRYTSQSGADFMGPSCDSCHTQQLKLGDGKGNTIVYSAFGTFGGGIGKNINYGIQLFEEAATRALSGGCNTTGLGALTQEEAVEAGRIITALDAKAADGNDVGIRYQKNNYASQSSFIFGAQATIWAHWDVGTSMRINDFKICSQSGYGTSSGGGSGSSSGTASGTATTSGCIAAAPDLNNSMLSRARTHILGDTASGKDPFKNQRYGLMLRNENDAAGNPNKHYPDRPGNSWWANAMRPDSQSYYGRVFSGSYGCVGAQGEWETCEPSMQAFVLTLPLNSRYVMGPLTASVTAGLGLPAGTTGEQGHVFLDATAGLQNSAQLHQELNGGTTGPQAIPGIAAARGITVGQLNTGLAAFAQYCRPCHNDGKQVSLTHGGQGDLMLTVPGSTSGVWVNAAKSVPIVQYSRNLEAAFEANGEGNLAHDTAAVAFHAPATYGSSQIYYGPPAYDNRLQVPPLYGAFPKGRYTLCAVNLDYLFNYFDPNAANRQPDLIAINGMQFDVATGGFKIVNTVQNWSQSAYDLMVAQYGISNVWSVKEESSCGSNAAPQDAYNYNLHATPYNSLTAAQKVGLKALIVAMGAASTPNVYSELDQNYHTVTLMPGWNWSNAVNYCNSGPPTAGGGTGSSSSGGSGWGYCY